MYCPDNHTCRAEEYGQTFIEFIAGCADKAKESQPAEQTTDKDQKYK
jgi:hypothetical protein